MVRFHLVSPAKWDRQHRGFSKEAKIIYDYILTGPQRATEGIYRLPLLYLVADTGLIEDEALSALRELQEAGYVEYDDESETVLDRLALKRTPIKNGTDKEGNPRPDNRLAGALKQLHHVADSKLFPRFVALAQTFSPDLAAAIWDEFPDYLTKRNIDPSEDHASPSEGTLREEQLREEPEESPSRERAIASDALELVAKRLGGKVVGSVQS